VASTVVDVGDGGTVKVGGTSVEVGEATGSGVSVAAAVAVTSSVAVSVGLEVSVTVGLSVGVSTTPAVGVAVGIGVGAWDAVGVTVGGDWNRPETAARSVRHTTATSSSEANIQGLSFNTALASRCSH
jgi:hypothetical protein